MGALRMPTLSIVSDCGALLGALAWANGLTTYPPLVRTPLAVGLLVECKIQQCGGRCRDYGWARVPLKKKYSCPNSKPKVPH